MSMRREIHLATGKDEYADIIPKHTGMESCAPSHRFGPYVREAYLLHYVKSGKGSFINESNGKTYEVTKGNVFLIRPGEVTTYIADNDDPWAYIWIGFNGKAAEKFGRLPDVFSYPFDTFDKISENIGENTESADIYISLIFEIVFNLFSAERKEKDAPERVRDYIKFHYMEEISVESISQMFGLNRRYLSRIFREKYGLPIKDYIIEVRMKKAEEFLKLGHTVSEAAFMSGYSDVFGFSKMFSKRKGMAPSGYRKK